MYLINSTILHQTQAWVLPIGGYLLKHHDKIMFKLIYILEINKCKNCMWSHHLASWS